MADESATMSNEDRLIMANQIARNFGTLPHDLAATAVADHIVSFWDPRMRAIIFRLQEVGDTRIGDIAARPIDMLRAACKS